MFDKLIDVVAGALLPFFVLTLIFTSILELLASVTRLRERTLINGIRKLILGHDVSSEWTSYLKGFSDEVLNHPLLSPYGMVQSYVSSKAFAAAVCSILIERFSSIADLGNLQPAIERMPSCSLKVLLTSLHIQSNGDRSEFKLGIARWFDDAMERLSGNYKRICFFQSLCLSELIALSFNINAIQIIKAMADKDLLDAGIKVQMAANAAKGLSPTFPAEAENMYGLHVNLFLGSNWEFSWTAFLGCTISAFFINISAQLWFDVLQNKLKLNMRNTGPKPPRVEY